MIFEKEKVQRVVLDFMFDFCLVEGMVVMEIQELYRLFCVVNLKKICVELKNELVLFVFIDSFFNIKVIVVKEMKLMELQ